MSQRSQEKCGEILQRVINSQLGRRLLSRKEGTKRKLLPTEPKRSKKGAVEAENLRKRRKRRKTRIMKMEKMTRKLVLVVSS